MKIQVNLTVFVDGIDDEGVEQAHTLLREACRNALNDHSGHVEKVDSYLKRVGPGGWLADRPADGADPVCTICNHHKSAHPTQEQEHGAVCMGHYHVRDLLPEPPPPHSPLERMQGKHEARLRRISVLPWKGGKKFAAAVDGRVLRSSNQRTPRLFDTHYAAQAAGLRFILENEKES